MSRARRLVAQVALLPVLYAVSLPNPDLFAAVISVLVLATLPVNGTVAGILIWTSRQAPHVDTLRERADDAVSLFLMSLAASATALVAAALRAGIELPGRPVLALLAWLCLLVAVPALGWLGTWRTFWLPLVLRRRADERAAAAEDTLPPA